MLLFEWAALPLGESWLRAFRRLPFLAHKTLPVLIFASVFFFFVGLIRKRLWLALESSGYSTKSIAAPLLIIAGIISAGDLFWLSEAEKISCNPFRNTAISLNAGGWKQKNYTPRSVALLHRQWVSHTIRHKNAGDVLRFSRDLSLILHTTPQWGFFLKTLPQWGRYKIVKNDYKKSSPALLSGEKDLKKSNDATYPLLASFLETFEVGEKKEQRTLFLVRRYFLVMHWAWLILLGVLAITISLNYGQIGGYGRFLTEEGTLGRSELHWFGLAFFLFLALYVGEAWGYTFAMTNGARSAFWVLSATPLATLWGIFYFRKRLF